MSYFPKHENGYCPARCLYKSIALATATSAVVRHATLDQFTYAIALTPNT
jgi:hypothetical protein